MSDIKTVGEAFAPLIGQIIWGCKRTHGTVLSMEFGAPSLSIRDPICASHSASSAIRRRLARRHVSLVGEWHLLIDHAAWEIWTEAGGLITSAGFDDAYLRLCLEDLDGQYLISANPGSQPASRVLAFDLGGQVILRPTGSAEEDQWLLFGPNGLIITLGSDGGFVTEDAGR